MPGAARAVLLVVLAGAPDLAPGIRVEAATACVQTLQMDKVTVMRRCELPARDLRLLNLLFVYPSTVLGRERAIVVNLEQIRCVITVDEVLLLNSLDSSARQRWVPRHVLA